ncbi:MULTISPECIES: oligosaccharide biosynthesis protein Alg14 [Vreelandella]|uniref:Oligosaccharide biosynthesis protein Alg14 n=2 Tax=Vreelandella TaxID=3137766 RepID=A0A7C9NMU7_9GAMM|nr:MULTISPECIES: oligosaccharide biosynthesis protein Alg14 [Halomonas]NDL70409.1 oligosaccharide biosynthesis protein Alg14 [Halomonas alkaliphila]NYS43378.1 oligosaccharide biosynthesis protein Alg14 [Halomonas zhaodongensis]
MKILMVASFGGHFIQLKRLYEQLKSEAGSSPATFEFAVTEKNINVDGKKALYFANVHRESGIRKMLSTLLKVFRLLQETRPDVVISTGALPGLIVCFAAKLKGKKVIWLDSMANYQKMSFSGNIAKFFCDVCLTQWEHLAANDNRVSYWGKVL